MSLAVRVAPCFCYGDKESARVCANAFDDKYLLIIQ